MATAKPSFNASKDANTLVQWFEQGHRPLPWRETTDPYSIWISEVMLQQTTSTAVIPYYHAFLKRFPTVEKLARANESSLMEQWSGLGYYSRARNLHKAAKAIVANKHFPTAWQELIEMPGFGPYTARSVASLAFQQKVGVLDGNVIRVLSRRHNLAVEWWKTVGRNTLQALTDQLAQATTADSGKVNQGLMELGATICLPKNPKCLLCPWSQSCESLKAGTVDQLPLSKPKRASEIWVWKPQIVQKNGRVALTRDHDYPFLRGHLAFPGKATKRQAEPRKFTFKHSVTHHKIYVVVEEGDLRQHAKTDLKWIYKSQLKKRSPTTLVNKALSTWEGQQ